MKMNAERSNKVKDEENEWMDEKMNKQLERTNYGWIIALNND